MRDKKLRSVKSYHGPIFVAEFGALVPLREAQPGKRGDRLAVTPAIQLTQGHGQPDLGFIQLTAVDALRLSEYLQEWAVGALRRVRPYT